MADAVNPAAAAAAASRPARLAYAASASSLSSSLGAAAEGAEDGSSGDTGGAELLPLLSRAVSVLCELRLRCENATRALEACLDAPLPFGAEREQRDIMCTAQVNVLVGCLDETRKLQALAWSEAVGGAERAGFYPQVQQRLLRVLQIGIRGCRSTEDVNCHVSRIQQLHPLLTEAQQVDFSFSLPLS